MKWQLATVLAALAAAVVFGLWVELPRLFDAFQPLIVATSIMIAGILVRLNRGMPTLDWKGLENDERKRLTQAVLELNREYLSILAMNASLAAILVGLSVVGKAAIAGIPDPPATAGWPALVLELVSGGLGALLAICVCRVAYMAWRDVDLVKLQKVLIDAAGDREFKKEQTELAQKRLEAAKGANLRRVEPTPIRDWSAQ